jgi:hypothetical protein
VFVFDKGKIDGAKYREVILPRLSQVSQACQDESLFNQQPIIVQDNAPIHKAFSTMALFKSSGLIVMD